MSIFAQNSPVYSLPSPVCVELVLRFKRLNSLVERLYERRFAKNASPVVIERYSRLYHAALDTECTYWNVVKRFEEKPLGGFYAQSMM